MALIHFEVIGVWNVEARWEAAFHAQGNLTLLARYPP